MQVDAKDSNVAPGAQALELQAVRTSNDTGAREGALVGPNSIELRLVYDNPGTGTQDIDINGKSVGTSFTPVSLDFGDATDSTAAFVLIYPDAGTSRWTRSTISRVWAEHGRCLHWHCRRRADPVERGRRRAD